MRLTAWVAFASLIGLSFGFGSININNNVTTGRNSSVSIVNDANDATAVYYTVWLYTTASNLPIFALIDSLPISDSDFSVSSPPSVGPSGYYYRIALVSFTANDDGIFPTPTYSDLFFLSNATGVLASFETVASGSFFDGTPYNAGQIPCASYDCTRQCARVDPPGYNPSADPGGQSTIYGSRYIACLEACPGMPNPLPVDNFATTTTGTGTLTTPTPVPTGVVNASCNVADFITPCGSQCCNAGVACYIWNDCEEESDEQSTSMSATHRGSTTTAGAGGTATGASTTTSTSSPNPMKSGVMQLHTPLLFAFSSMLFSLVSS